MAALDIPLVLVAGSYLGSLSHTLTALDALRRRNLDIKAVVVNETPGSTVPLIDTVETLQRFAAPASVIALRRSPTNDAFAEIASRIDHDSISILIAVSAIASRLIRTCMTMSAWSSRWPSGTSRASGPL